MCAVAAVLLLLGRYSKDKARLGDTLEVIKFICKDFWLAVFKKQVDNLKTNHRVRAHQPAAATAAAKHEQQLLCFFLVAALEWHAERGYRQARVTATPMLMVLLLAAGHLHAAGQQLPLAAASEPSSCCA